MSPPDPRAVAYARFSTDRQDARSIDDQLRRCHAFAEARGLKVVEEFKDAAMSGSHVDRADLQRLLAASRARGGSPFSAVIVDDLSRLSRDLGNTWNIIFEQLAGASVRVFDATTGMASDGAGARLTFGAMALVNDTFLQLVKTETHRGLEGRALGGFATGGRVFGYTTEKEPNPPDPEHPRSVIKINEEEAAIVRRIFTAYKEGIGLARIAADLNRDGIPAPYDTTSVRKKRGRGWAQTTLRAMLLNERYAGRFVWNKRKFVRRPGSKIRRAVPRPEAEWRVLQRPELAVVDPGTLAAVQARFADRQHAPGGRPLGATARHPHLFSGIARCGTCGAGLGVVSSLTKNGVRYVNMGCSAHSSRGDAICSNGLCVSERKLNAGILGALSKALLEPAGHLRTIVEQFQTWVAASKASPGEEAARLERAIQEADRAVRNLTEAVVQAGWSEALRERLREEENRLRELRHARAAMAKPPPAAASGEHVEAFMRDLLKQLGLTPIGVDVERGREVLRRHLGTVTLTPHAEGDRRFYAVKGAYDLACMFDLGSTPVPALDPGSNSAPSWSAGGRVFGNKCCGGRI